MIKLCEEFFVPVEKNLVIDFTEKAAKHIVEFLTRSKKAQPLRLHAQRKGGCGDLTPEYLPNAVVNPDDDTVVTKFGLTLVCNLELIPEFEGVVIDLVHDMTLKSDKLTLVSPALSACGCGKAVTPKKV